MSSCGKFAEGGWLVEVRLTIDEEPDFRFFAVGVVCPQEAEEAILRYPGIFRDDARKVRRQLPADEIARLQLRVQGVRPYRVERSAQMSRSGKFPVVADHSLDSNFSAPLSCISGLK